MLTIHVDRASLQAESGFTEGDRRIPARGACSSGQETIMCANNRMMIPVAALGVSAL